MHNSFKAKLKYKDAWVIGDLVYINDGKRLIPHIYGKGEVLQKSICAYTGKKANGKKIFSNDILRFCDDEGELTDYIVFWDDSKSGFAVKEFERGLKDDLDDFFCTRSMVIGSVIDIQSNCNI